MIFQDRLNYDIGVLNNAQWHTLKKPVSQLMEKSCSTEVDVIVSISESGPQDLCLNSGGKQ